MPFRRGRIAMTLGVLALCGCRQQAPTPAAAPAPAATAEQAAAEKAAGSYRFERNGWIFVHLEGPPSPALLPGASPWTGGTSSL